MRTQNEKVMRKPILLVFICGCMLFGPLGPAAGQTAQIYAGTSGIGEGKVYAYQGGTTWTAISESLGYAVLDIIEFDGELYAATMSFDNISDIGKVWRYQGGTSWTVIGDNMDSQVSDLEVYDAQLYAGTSSEGGKLYRFNAGSDDFDLVGTVPDGDFAFEGIRAMYASSYGYLQLGDIGFDIFAHFDGTTISWDQDLDGSCIFDFEEFDGSLYASAWMGTVYESTDGTSWSIVLDWDNNDNFSEVWELETFQGELYIGYDDGELATLDTSPYGSSNVWNADEAITSMFADGDSTLYLGVGGEAGYYFDSGTGYVYAYTGSGAPTLISGPMGDGVQAIYIIPELAALLGDANGDGVVSMGDFTTVQGYYGNTGAAGILGDANYDGTVSAGDFTTIQGNYGNGAPSEPAAIPEPATLGLLLMGGLALLRHRRRT